MSKKIQGKSYWSNLAKWWRKVAPPVRPSKADLKIYENFLKQAVKSKKQLKILVLGSTPEMRDLAAKFRAETTICDINLEMMTVMGQLMKDKKAQQKEIWVRADWVDLPLSHNYYNVILADGVTTNFSWSEANKWWKNKAGVLKNSGVFITRVFYTISRIEAKKSLDGLIYGLSQKKTFIPADFAKLKILLELCNYNPKTRTVSTAGYEKLFFESVKQQRIASLKAKKIYQKLINIYPSKSVKIWRGPNKEQTEKEAKRYFRIIDEVLTSFPINTRIYLLQKK